MSRLSKLSKVKQHHTYHCQKVHYALMPKSLKSMCKLQGMLPCARCALGATYDNRNNYLYLTDTLGELDETTNQEPN